MFAPESVNVPVPDFVTPPVPESTLASVTSFAFVSKVAPFTPMAFSLAEMSVVFAVAHCKPPPLRVIFAVPRFAPSAKLTSPPFIVVPPL
ncbi:MAG: hypothetical protein NTZ60_01010 [Campylobacterales bacterium]|nr:hypothetical protein [Campylobacterales bacterium]